MFFRPSECFTNPIQACSCGGPCKGIANFHVLQQRVAERWREFSEELQRTPLPETSQAINERVEEAFTPVYDRIPALLDWHYSLRGQITELALRASGRHRPHLCLLQLHEDYGSGLHVEAFTARVRSACPVVDGGLRAAARQGLVGMACGLFPRRA